MKHLIITLTTALPEKPSVNHSSPHLAHRKYLHVHKHVFKTCFSCFSTVVSSTDTWLSVDDTKRLTESLITVETQGKTNIIQ